MATSTLVLNKNYIDLELTNVSDEQLAWFQGAVSAMVGNYRVVNAVLDPRKEIVYVSLALVSTKQKIDMDLL